jgi:hypothetical protein
VGCARFAVPVKSSLLRKDTRMMSRLARKVHAFLSAVNSQMRKVGRKKLQWGRHGRT